MNNFRDILTLSLTKMIIVCEIRDPERALRFRVLVDGLRPELTGHYGSGHRGLRQIFCVLRKKSKGNISWLSQLLSLGNN